jgi:hypothetical protein
MKYTYATKLNGTDQTGIVDLETSSIVAICDEETARFVIDTLNQRDELIVFCENQEKYLSKQFESVENYSNEYSRLLGQKQAFQSVLQLIKKIEQ